MLPKDSQLLDNLGPNGRVLAKTPLAAQTSALFCLKTKATLLMSQILETARKASLCTLMHLWVILEGYLFPKPLYKELRSLLVRLFPQSKTTWLAHLLLLPKTARSIHLFLPQSKTNWLTHLPPLSSHRPTSLSLLEIPLPNLPKIKTKVLSKTFQKYKGLQQRVMPSSFAAAMKIENSEDINFVQKS